MNCVRAEWLDGYFDGELDAARAAEFEAHLEGCADCAATLGRQQALREAIAGAGLYAPATATLGARVRRALPDHSSAPPRRRLAWLAAAAAVVALGGLWQLGALRREPAADRLILASILDAHVRSLQPGHLTDVVSSDRHTVRPWFDGRLDFSPPVADLASEGFPLAGGRLDVVNGRSVAALVYGRRKHVVTLFVWPSAEAGTKSAASGSVHGYQWICWRREGMTFWAVADTSAEDLEEFARLLRR